MTWNEIINLVTLARAGDRAAFGELVERVQPAVYALALARLRNAHEAQELTQEVFIHAMQKLDQLRDPHCFLSWLRQITVRMAINRLTRRGHLFGAEPEVLANAPAAVDSPLDEIVRAEDRAEVLTGLTRLKGLDRDTLEAFYLHGRSLKQMSRDFDTPVGTIKRRLHVARKRLRKLLDKVLTKRPRRREEAVATP
jgi:RNA polymerase sigma-70 factor, ECF subfamily